MNAWRFTKRVKAMFCGVGNFIYFGSRVTCLPQTIAPAFGQQSGEGSESPMSRHLLGVKRALYLVRVDGYGEFVKV